MSSETPTSTPQAVAPEGEVVLARGLGKCYQIYDQPRDRLWQTICMGRKQFYRPFWALRDVNLAIRRGETVGVIGRNGSGKSTLLQLVCGTLAATAGSVETRGRVAALLELGAGFNPDFTGRENVFLNALLYGQSHERTQERFAEIAAFADIGSFIDQPVKTYSSGMYVRLAFAVAAHVDADILIIDEALAVGDVFFTQKCMRFLRKFREQGTILFVSHDLAAVVNLCGRAIWLDQGCVRALGPAKEVSETYQAAFRSENAPPGEPAPATPTPSAETTRDVPLAAGAVPRTVGDADFGDGGARILDVRVLNARGQVVSSLLGPEEITLVVRVAAQRAITRPIVGFHFKDRLGQNLFGENTFTRYAADPVPVDAGSVFEARFTFICPTLYPGDYTIAIGVAEGTQDEHRLLHWIYDAVAIRSLAKAEYKGLLALPMLAIDLHTEQGALI